MNTFNVLDRNQNIHHSYLLEASAGTGKTFSIENIVVRLLIEGENPLPIEKILVVTFTKAATRDLRLRIRQAIQSAIERLENPSEKTHDYLRSILEQGDEASMRAQKRLDDALFAFDQAQIFTIHGFCFRMLRQNTFEGDFSCDALLSEDSVSDEELLRIIRDYFRSKLRPDICNHVQVEVVLNHQKNKLENKFLKTIKEGYDIQPGPTYAELFGQFEEAVVRLKKHSYTYEKIIADYEKQLPFYNKADGEHAFSIEDFAHLLSSQEITPKQFNQLIRNQFYYLRKFHPDNANKRKKGIPATELNYPALVSELQQTLAPIVHSASSYEKSYSRLAFECQQMVSQYLEENEKMVFGDFLESMANALQQPAFCAFVQDKYQAAIIDEFQDTDPVQWTIFKKLFLTDNKYLYLVGDPKQSIYAFRRADIYTYRDAAFSIPQQHHGCLDTNYRSQPSLILALNQLFSAAKNFIELPRVNGVLDFHPVKASPKATDCDFKDDRGSLHFMISESKEAEEKDIFPFVLNEIQRMNTHDVPLKKIAVLVKDRFQAARFADLCGKYLIPVALQKRGQLSDSPLIENLQEILRAVLHPKNLSCVKIALASGLIGWDHRQVKELSDIHLLEKVMGKFYQLRSKLHQEGFSGFYAEFLNCSWHDHQLSTREVLLRQIGGAELLDELDQIASLLIDHQGRTQCIAEMLIKFLTDFKDTESQEDDSVKKQTDSHRDAVQVLSMHSSKGLEYDVVFALGLSASSSKPGLLIPVPQGTRQILKAVEEDGEEYQAYCREMNAEKMRQLYVAMTRAKHRLYVPVVLSETKKQSIFDLFLSKLPIERNVRSLTAFIDEHRPQMSYSVLDGEEIVEPMKAQQTHLDLIEPKVLAIPGQQRFMQSYTSMTKRFLAAIPSTEEQALKPPREFNVPYKNPHTLPAGAETGIVLHKIFENIPLNCCSDKTCSEEIAPLIRPFLKGTPYEEWLTVFCDMIYKSLTTRFGGIRLSDIDPEQCYREVEFLYPSQNGFTKGVIDLVFEHEGLYYIVDWKSNWLGSQNESYNTACMNRAMLEHDYFLQRDLYIQAWKRYLGMCTKKVFEECFGGVYYFFVRGISDTTGIFKA